MAIRRVLGAFIVHVFTAAVWAMDRTIDENLWEEAANERRTYSRLEPSR
jgi:hypothetical protein